MSGDLKPILGFVVVRCGSDGLVPQVVISPLDVASVADVADGFSKVRAVVRLTNGAKLRLYEDTIESFSERLNKAMQERLAMHAPAREDPTPRKG